MTGGFVRFSISLKINRPHKVGQINFILKWKAYDFKICTVTKNAFLFQDERCLGNPFFLKFHFSKLEGLLQIFHNASLGLQRGNLVFFLPQRILSLKKKSQWHVSLCQGFQPLGISCNVRNLRGPIGVLKWNTILQIWIDPMIDFRLVSQTPW